MSSRLLPRAGVRALLLALLAAPATLLPGTAAAAGARPLPDDPPRIAANDNRRPAGTLRDGVPTVRLDVATQLSGWHVPLRVRCARRRGRPRRRPTGVAEPHDPPAPTMPTCAHDP